MESLKSLAIQQDHKFAGPSQRDRFHFPQFKGREVIYLTGNSLGLQPKSARSFVENEMKRWETLGVEGHFEGPNPWLDYHKLARKTSAMIVGAQEDEVSIMNSLTVNLHLLMVSFYRPQGQRVKILMEPAAFPSDQYVADSQARFHGLDPELVIEEFRLRPGEHTLRLEDMQAQIEALGDELALVLIGGVNYYSGQFFDLEALSKSTHQVGALIGVDLAHAAGNIPLQLHDWDIDFAAWCTYKYLNSGPGGISGIYIHQKHHQDASLPRFNGWWGYRQEDRFEMKKDFIPEPNVDAWQLSNSPIILLAAHLASLEIFEEVGIQALREKSKALTAYLESIILHIQEKFDFPIEIISPSDPEQRGCQLSLLVPQNGKDLFDFLHQNGVSIDWREPNVIRMAPTPLYNTFQELYELGQLLSQALEELSRAKAL